ncbi:hypothetical protein FJT64_026230 [Amphibalanus amphitrite]|uniref:Uncharacterized protein n=1 Tax=Amphibalanus amphitrite TaxID=1232801 RepID=A0A6A4WHE2_AMPAM|nr:hypothetical protein FJT64_026230 [Amphibalanus amphitrite]
MSWFDTTGFANLAKSALKEAQKTFDKALDLPDIEEKPSADDNKGKDDSESFFSAFGLGGSSSSGSGGAGGGPSATSAGGSERLAASLWGSLGASLLGDAATAEQRSSSSSAEPPSGPVTSPPNGLTRNERSATPESRPEPPSALPVGDLASADGWAEPPSASPGDISALRGDSPSPDGFQSSVLVVASPSSEWPPPLPPPGDTATPESIEVLDGSDHDWEAGWEAGGDSTGTLQDADAPAESLHSSNSSCHTLVSADGGATYSASVAPPRGRPADSPGESTSSESFIRLGLGASPLTSPDAGNMTSPDVRT